MKNDSYISTESSIKARVFDNSDYLTNEEYKEVSNSKSRSARVSTVVNGVDTMPLYSDFEINGTINDANGNPPEGRLEVELPSAMSFTVDEKGNFISASNYDIYNKSSCPIEVSVIGFSEEKSTDGITVQQRQVTDQDARNVMNLKLRGNQGEVQLYSGTQLKSVLAEVSPKSKIAISLDGRAGKGANQDVDANGVTENFTVKFNVRKKN